MIKFLHLFKNYYLGISFIGIAAFVIQEMEDKDSYHLITEGRLLYMDVNDRCGPPYTVVLDPDYETLCPWADVVSSGKVWPDVLTDAAVEIFESEKNNREQRRKRREERKLNESSEGNPELI